jgi:hypothetical protein
MYTEKSEQERPIETINVPMAIDNKKEYQRQIFDRPTTEEHEKTKKEFSTSVSKELIGSFSAEDRFDIFNDIRRELEKALRSQVEDMAYRLKTDRYGGVSCHIA